MSDTAVHKAIKAGRITIAARTPSSGRPLVAWPQAQADWQENSDSSKRTHVGGTGKSPQRARDAVPPAAPVLQTRAQVQAVEAATPAADDFDAPAAAGQPAKAVQGPTLAQSKAVREAYLARLAKLEYEREVGKVISADEAKAKWFKHVTAAKTRILGIPAACKQRVADLPLAAVAAIEAVCREALEDLANGRD